MDITGDIARIFGDHWLLYLSLPLIAALLGYLTKRVAIAMMFRPVEFFGVPRTALGWQGVVPRNAERMIATATDLLTTRLVDAKEIFARIDPNLVAKRIEGPLLAAIDGVTREVLARHQPRLWEMLPTLAQDMLVKQVQAGAPAMVHRLVTELRDNIDDFLDVRELAVSALRRDRALLVRLIKDISRPELAFIERSGIYFGFALGVVQTAILSVTTTPVVLPICGMIIGWFTDWLAIKLVFFPRDRVMILGILPFQGIFQRRRADVSRDYAELIAREVITIPNIIETLLHGRRSPRLRTLIQRIVRDAIDERLDPIRPVVSAAVGPRRLRELKHAAATMALDHVATTARHAEGYLTSTMDIGNTIAGRMRALSRKDYEALLRPAFRRDEWKLIAVGAIIGLLVGELQVLLLLR